MKPLFTGQFCPNDCDRPAAEKYAKDLKSLYNMFLPTRATATQPAVPAVPSPRLTGLLTHPTGSYRYWFYAADPSGRSVSCPPGSRGLWVSRGGNDQTDLEKCIKNGWPASASEKIPHSNDMVLIEKV